jgi:acylphosphatase
MPVWEIIARGRVQGVGFRYFVKRCAEQYRVKGYAQNLYDGTVKIIADAQESDFIAFLDLVRSGSRHAVVSGLDATLLENANKYYDFDIR